MAKYHKRGVKSVDMKLRGLRITEEENKALEALMDLNKLNLRDLVVSLVDKELKEKGQEQLKMEL